MGGTLHAQYRDATADSREKIEALNARIADLRKQMVEESKRLFPEALTGLWEAHPKMYGFRFTQYTPYFNDGEECVFHVYGDETPILSFPDTADAEHDKQDEEDEGRHYAYYYSRERWEEYGKKYGTSTNHPRDNEWYKQFTEPYPEYMEWKSAAQKDVEQLLHSMDKSVMKEMFGDHVEITVTRDGTDVEHHHHD